jgi:GxxExxY protein
MKDISELCEIVRETAYAIHIYHGHGHLEKVYENALSHRLRKSGLNVLQQHPIAVFDEDGTIIGEYFADLIVEGILIAELKACRALVSEHTAQILGYLRSARVLCVLCGYFCESTDSTARTLTRETVGRLTFVFFAFFCGYSSFAAGKISLANLGLAHSFPALYAKGDCETQNEESSGETL